VESKFGSQDSAFFREGTQRKRWKTLSKHPSGLATGGREAQISPLKSQVFNGGGEVTQLLVSFGVGGGRPAYEGLCTQVCRSEGNESLLVLTWQSVGAQGSGGRGKSGLWKQEAGCHFVLLRPVSRSRNMPESPAKWLHTNPQR